MASMREIVGLETMIGAYGCELIDDTTQYFPPEGLAIGSIIPTEEAIIDTCDELVRLGGLIRRYGAITAQANYNPPVTDAVSVTSTGHGLITGQKVTISIDSDPEYDGVKDIVVIDADTFYFVHPHAFMGDYGAGHWEAYVNVRAQEVTGKNWLDTALPQGTQIFPNWNNPFTSVTLTSGAVMVYFVKI